MRVNCRLQRQLSRDKVGKPPPTSGRPKILSAKPTTAKPQRPSLPKVRALYAYDAQDTEELSFNQADIIEVIQESKQTTLYMVNSKHKTFI